MRHAADPPLVGREREWEALLSHLAIAREGVGRAVLLAGEPGIGKSRLLATLAAHAEADGWLVLSGRAYESEGLPAYLPIADALRPYIRRTAPDILAAQAGSGAAQLVRLLPELTGRLPNLSPDAALSPEHERYRLFESVTDFLLAAASGREEGGGRRDEASEMPGALSLTPHAASHRAGLLLILDDLHWADRPTLLLVQHLARRLRGAPLLLAGAYRTVELGRSHPLAAVLAELRRERLAERILLGGLDGAGVASLVEQLAGVAPAPELAAAIQRETDGNPFFVEEIVRHLQMEGRNLADPREGAAAWGIPEGVREVIGERLSRLGEPANALLAAGSVLSDGFEPATVGRTAGLDGQTLAAAIDEAVAAGILREEGGAYHFTHALIRQTVYGELSLPRRQALHARAVGAIEAARPGRVDAHIQALAMHAHLAGAEIEPSRRIEYATRAADAALRTFAWEEAAAQREHVLDLLPEDDALTRCRTLLALGEARRRAGWYPAADAAVEEAAGLAARHGAADLLARAALDFGLGGEISGATNERLLGLLDDARLALGDEDSDLRAEILARLSWQQLTPDRIPQRRAYGAEAVAVARRLKNPIVLAHALAAHHWGVGGPESIPARLAIAEEIVRIGLRTGDPETTLSGRLWRICDLLEAGEVATLDREIDAYQRLAGTLRQPYFSWYVPLFLAMRALLAGNLDAADQQADLVLAVGLQGQPTLATLHHGLVKGLVALTRGQPGEALGIADRYLQPFVDLPPVACTIAAWRAAAGDLTGARALLDPVAGSDLRALPVDEDWLAIVILVGMVACATEDQALASAVGEALTPYADRFPIAGNAAFSFGSARLTLARLAALRGRREEALEHAVAAVAANMRIGARPWTIESVIEHARLLLDGDAQDRARAEDLLTRAEADARAIGMGAAAARAASLRSQAAASRNPPPSSLSRSLPDGLSEREAEVLRLIAEGRTNREIADALVLSVRTVERHIAHIYGKTNARGRADATRYAVRYGLVEPPTR